MNWVNRAPSLSGRLDGAPSLSDRDLDAWPHGAAAIEYENRGYTAQSLRAGTWTATQRCRYRVRNEGPHGAAAIGYETHDRTARPLFDVNEV